MPAEKATATWRDVQPVLRKAITKGRLGPTLSYVQFTKQVANATRTLMRTHTGVTDAAAAALTRMQEAGEISLPLPQGGRPRWMPKWKKTPPAAGHRAQTAVEDRMRASLLTRLAAGERVTAAALRSAYKNQHWKAKGNPDELTEAINQALWEQQLAGNLWKPPVRQAPKVMVLFAGGQSGTAPAALLGLECINYEIEKEYRLSATETVTVPQSTDLTEAPDAGMISWCAGREGVREEEIRTVTVGQPCHTQTVLDHGNRSRGNHFRTKGGKPRPDTGKKMTDGAREKREEAQKEDALALNVQESLEAWLWKWAIQGVQRWYWIEDGRWGHLRNQSYMKLWGEPLTANYCMYRVFLGHPEVYPAPKTTGVWTNIQTTLKRCPRKGWHANHPSTIGAASNRRVTLPEMDPYPSKRWTPQELQLDLHIATLNAQDKVNVQAAVSAAWAD